MLKSDSSLKPFIGLAVIALILAALAMACETEEETPVAAPAPTAVPVAPAATVAPATAVPVAPATTVAPAPAPAAPAVPESDASSQYGGTYTYGGISLSWNTNPTSWDVSESGTWQMFCYSHYYQSVMLTGDIETYRTSWLQRVQLQPLRGCPAFLLEGRPRRKLHHRRRAHRVQDSPRRHVARQRKDRHGA